jgi:AraC family transcriptional regulator
MTLPTAKRADWAGEAGLLFPKVGRCDAFAEVPGACVELRQYVWSGHSHEGSFAIAKRFLELTDVDAHGGYHVRGPQWNPLGRIRFYPGNRRFYSRWSEDRQTSLLCALDVPHLTGIDFEIGNARLPECGNLTNGYLKTLLVRIRNELVAPGFASHMVIESACMAAAAELVHHFTGPPTPARQRGDRLSSQVVADLAASIRAGDAPASLDVLAKQEGVSARHYARLLRAATGESVSRFYARQMSHRGKDLLRDRALLIKEIAYRCGFANTASFTRAFRRETGMSPQQYRDQPGSGRNRH